MRQVVLMCLYLLMALVVGTGGSFASQRIIAEYGRNNNSRDVRAIQSALARLGFFSDRVDGFFSDRTRNAVIMFQSRNNLRPTGVVDNLTAEAIFAPDNNNPAPTAPTPPPAINRACSDFRPCPYVVIVPGNQDRLFQFRGRLLDRGLVIGNELRLEDHPRGSFINAGNFADRSTAEERVNLLRNNGISDARVEYIPTVTPSQVRG